MEKYPNDECMQDYMKKLKYKIQVEYKYQVYTRQMMKPIFTRSENRMFYYINHEMNHVKGDVIILPIDSCLLYGRYNGYLDDEYNLLFKEVTIKKKKYVNDKIKSIFELIYQRASTTKNDGIVKMVNDSIWILKRVNAENSRDKQWKEDMIKKLGTVYDTDKWDIGMVRS